jgi:hypothetical protein
MKSVMWSNLQSSIDEKQEGMSWRAKRSATVAGKAAIPTATANHPAREHNISRPVSQVKVSTDTKQIRFNQIDSREYCL